MPVWSHKGDRLIVASSLQQPDLTYMGYLQSFAVDQSLGGGFQASNAVPIGNRRFGYGHSFSADDRILYACEIDESVQPAIEMATTRPVGALGIANPPFAVGACSSTGGGGKLANVIVADR